MNNRISIFAVGAGPNTNAGIAAYIVLWNNIHKKAKGCTICVMVFGMAVETAAATLTTAATAVMTALWIFTAVMITGDGVMTTGGGVMMTGNGVIAAIGGDAIGDMDMAKTGAIATVTVTITAIVTAMAIITAKVQLAINRFGRAAMPCYI